MNESVSGYSLAAFAGHARHRPLWLLGILIEAAERLTQAHTDGVAHGALAPEHVFVTEDRRGAQHAKVVGWGGEADEPFAALAARDVIALGTIAYELLLGRPPLAHAPALPPSELWPQIPRQLEDLLLEMLADDPRRRPAMSQVWRRLQATREELENLPVRGAAGLPSPNLQRLVEDRLRAHPGVSDAVVVAGPDRISMALVVIVRHAHVSERELREFCQLGLPDRLCPQKISMLFAST